MPNSTHITSHPGADFLRRTLEATLVLSTEQLTAGRQVLARHAPEVADWSDADILSVMTELSRAALVVSLLSRTRRPPDA